MADVIPFPSRAKPRRVEPVTDAMDRMLSFETPNQRWLRLASQQLRDSRDDGPEAA